MSIRKRQRKGGVTYQVTIEHRVGGVRQQLRKSFRRLADAQAYERVQAAEAVRDTLGLPVKTPTSEYIAAWIAARSSRLQPNTTQNYRSLLTNYLEGTIGHIPLGELTARDIEALYGQLRVQPLRGGKGRPLSESTISHVHRLLTGALRAAVRTGLLRRNPLDQVEPPRPPKPDTGSLSVADAKALPGRLPEPYRTAALLALYTGLRRSEVCGLQWGDIDGDQLTVRRRVVQLIGGSLHVGDPKTASSNRTVTMPPTLVAHLAARVSAESPRNPRHYVLTDDVLPLRPERLSAAFRRLGISLHQATRHTHATLLLAEGVPLPDVSARLGHADPSITARIYAHVLAGRDQATAAAFERAIG